MRTRAHTHTHTRTHTHTHAHTHTQTHTNTNTQTHTHTQIVGTLSRMLATVMAVLPVQREGWLSDNEAVRRFMRRPNTIVDGYILGQKDIVLGCMAAFAGACIVYVWACVGACVVYVWMIAGACVVYVWACVGGCLCLCGHVCVRYLSYVQYV